MCLQEPRVHLRCPCLQKMKPTKFHVPWGPLGSMGLPMRPWEKLQEKIDWTQRYMKGDEINNKIIKNTFKKPPSPIQETTRLDFVPFLIVFS